MKYTNFDWGHQQIDFVTDHGLSLAVGVRTVFVDEASKIAFISDEAIWQSLSATGAGLEELALHYKQQGYTTAVNVTPYTFHGSQKVMEFVFGPGGRPKDSDFGETVDTDGMSPSELRSFLEGIGADSPYVDMISIDPYYFNEGMVDKATLLNYTSFADDVIHNMGKQAGLVLQGFAFQPDTKEFLAEQVKLGGYDFVTSFSALDSGFPKELNISDEEVALIVAANQPQPVVVIDEPVQPCYQHHEVVIELVNEPDPFQWVYDSYGGGA